MTLQSKGQLLHLTLLTADKEPTETEQNYANRPCDGHNLNEELITKMTPFYVLNHLPCRLLILFSLLGQIEFVS